MKKEVFVVTDHGKGWGVRTSGSERMAKVFDTKAEACEYGRELARSLCTELRIQNRNGQFGTCNSYGEDECPPKDKNR